MKKNIKKIADSTDIFKHMLLLTLFLLSILGIFVLTKISPIQLKWVALLFLPISILSVVLGLRYYNRLEKNYSLTKRNIIKNNIVCGSMMIIFYIFCICYSVIYSTKDNEISSDYNYYLTNLEEKINFEFPNNSSIKHSNSIEELSNNQILISTSTIKFNNNEEIKDLEKKIKNSSLWIKEDTIILQKLAPIDYINMYNLNNYYLIYIEEFDTFNTAPSQSGVYKTFCFIYNIKQNKLKIYEYYLSFSVSKIN